MSAIMKQESSFDMSPQNMTEAKEFAETFVKSAFCPKFLQGKPGDALMVMQLGFELGLKPMQTFKTIGCINGIPFAYGDGKLALVKRSAHFEWIKEWSEGSFDKGDLIAYCTVKRVNGEENTRSFSMAQAKRAGLLGKTGPWQQYPERMLQHRARGFALNDTFADVLYGIADEDEAREIAEKDITPPEPIKNKGAAGVRELLSIPQKQPDVIGGVLDSVPEPLTINHHANQVVNLEQTQSEAQDSFTPPELATAQQISDLHELIIQHGVSDMTVNKWLKKANAEVMEEMSQSEIQACIDFIIKKVAGDK